MFHFAAIILGSVLGSLVGMAAGQKTPGYLIFFQWGGMLIVWVVAITSRKLRADEAKRASDAIKVASDIKNNALRIARQQAELDQSAADLRLRSIRLFEEIPSHLNAAAKSLDGAQSNFQNREFLPFWAAIENAVRDIRNAKRNVEIINDHSSSYEVLARRSLDPLQKFPLTKLSVQSLSAIDRMSTRLTSVVQSVQSDFQFVTIYQQRKTNEILIEGFQSVTDAVYSIGSQITGSIDGLAGTIDSLSSLLDARLASIDSHVQSTGASVKQSVEDVRGTVVEISSELQRRNDQTIEMLDNIQRRRKPSGERVKDFWTDPV